MCLCQLNFPEYLPDEHLLQKISTSPKCIQTLVPVYILVQFQNTGTYSNVHTVPKLIQALLCSNIHAHSSKIHTGTYSNVKLLTECLLVCSSGNVILKKKE